MAASVRFLLLLALACTASAQDDPFRKWLQSLTIRVPTISFALDQGAVNLTIVGFVCDGIDFTSINSKYNTTHALDLAIGGIKLYCGGRWNAFDVKEPLINGEGNVSITVDDSFLNTSLRLLQDGSGFANATDLTYIELNIMIRAIIFKGFGQRILDLITENKHVRGLMSAVIDTAIRMELTTLVNTNLTQVFTAISNKARPYLTPRPLRRHHPSRPVPCRCSTTT
eukprot:m.28711 g.28711  ORF g.28711 m.28711 type:complete len:226 (+) comp4583_c0_seq1:242-919(+)